MIQFYINNDDTHITRDFNVNNQRYRYKNENDDGDNNVFNTPTYKLGFTKIKILY